MYVSVQRDATICGIYSLFHCKSTLHVSDAFTHIIRSTGNCSCFLYSCSLQLQIPVVMMGVKAPETCRVDFDSYTMHYRLLRD
jgi:hypothetical protein